MYSKDWSSESMWLDKLRFSWRRPCCDGFSSKIYRLGYGMHHYAFIFHYIKWQLTWLHKRKKMALDKDILYPPFCLCYVLNISQECCNHNSKFNFHPKCSSLKFRYPAFADDLMLFVKGDVISILILIECSAKFGDSSGLRMNTMKSSLYTAGIHRHEL